MNYLAHAYLSFNEPGILVGNMISDFVKGKKKFEYSDIVQKGIMLHRAIDEFTDFHSATKAAKLFFIPAYRLYSGAFVDVIYDYFLANDADIFNAAPDLESFSMNVYQTLENNFSQLPENFQNIFPFMRSGNWLYNYQYKWGIEKSFQGLVHRSAYMNESDTAFLIFNEHCHELKKCYDEFFPEAKEFALHQLRNF